MNISSRACLKMLAVLAMVLVSSAHAQTNSRPSSITFLDTVYSSAWAADAEHGWAAVYLPEGESLPDYTNMLRIEHTTNESVTDAVNRQLQFLHNVKNSNNSSVKILELIDDAIEDGITRTGEVLLVYLFVMEENEIAKWRWSAYRYIPMQTADGKQGGSRLFDHSRQYIGNDKEGIERFLADIGDKKAERINALTKLQIP